MACLLRVRGILFDPGAFLKGAAVSPATIWQRGQPRLSTREDRKVHGDAGFTLEISNADGYALSTQVQDATAFLERNSQELNRLKEFPGLEDIVIDFCVFRKRGIVAATYSLGSELITVAGKLGIQIDVSEYEVDE